MRTSEADILVIPGLDGAGPGHWQTRWEARLSTARRIAVEDRAHPNREQWTHAIAQAVQAAQRPVVFVAHCLGVIALAHAAALLTPGAARGALLVTPPSPAALLRIPEMDAAFLPYPEAPLPFPSLLVASRSDPYADYADCEALALAWGSKLTDAGHSGHLDDASGHGPWPEGLMSFAAFLRQL